MTELELLEMLSGVQSSYIQQADAFRERSEEHTSELQSRI